jgi:hypothetical protein
MKFSVSFVILSIAFSSPMSFASSIEAGEAKAALLETMLEARMAAAEKEISPPVFAEPAKKIEPPILFQLSESEVQSDDEEFKLDEE